MLDLLTLQASSPQPTLLAALYTVLVSFLLSAAVGVTYIKTFRGLSYSPSYIAALILSSIVAATVMQAIGDSLARGIGMLGALAIIRFRTNFKDSRDIIFMFAALAAGIACGVGGYTVAVVGTAAFIVCVVLLSYTQLTQASSYDGLLRFNMPTGERSHTQLDKILADCCCAFALITLREIGQGGQLDYAYHIKLKQGTGKDRLLARLRADVPTIRGVSLMLQEASVDL